MIRRRTRPPQIKQSDYLCRGGINMIAGAHDIAPGEALILSNYEIDVYGHYRRINGYERFDGQPRPSEYIPTGVEDDAAYEADLQANVEARRALIQPVPGEGRILGVVHFQGNVYAFRNVVGGASAKMYCSSPAGWVEVTTPVLNPGGEYRFDIANMDGAGPTGIRLYGVNGVDNGFVFDGTTFTQISTGAEPTAFPFLVKVYKNHLFYAYPNGNLQHSDTGVPETWAGGAVIGISDEITDLVVPPGGKMVILSRNRSDVIYGSSKDDWVVDEYSGTIGSISRTAQVMGDVFYLDDIGIAQLSRVQAFGDFNSSALSQNIQPLINKNRNLAIASSTIKNRNQYRIYFDNGTAITCTFKAGQLLGFTKLDFNQIVVRTIHSREDSNGIDRTYFGSDDGYVYEMDVGTSFDGQAIESVCRLAYHNLGSAEHYKRIMRAAAYIDVQEKANITITPDYNYSNDELPQQTAINYLISGAGGYYDSAVYGENRYSTPYINSVNIPVDATALNIGFVIYSKEIWDKPHTIKSMSLHYHYRRRNR